MTTEFCCSASSFLISLSNTEYGIITSMSFTRIFYQISPHGFKWDFTQISFRGVSNFRKASTTENTETRIRGTLMAARKRPSGNSLACVHLPYTDVFGWAIIG